MKRHVQLQPLSRQHHNGLLAVLLLKKGIKKAASSKEMAAFIFDFWHKDIEEHFKAEENFLVPAVANADCDKALIETLKEEHAVLRSYISLLQHNPRNMEVIEKFTNLLEQHIRFEEKIFFPAAENCLTEEQLTELGKHLHEGDTQNCMNYPVKFWE
ncbi:hemerythrin domain-containing protein [Panacibacter ginsenosidivorans]|uniref:Hemerythrin domain-containing protein n=1 Tax=Panacibacter ginsenosidivorans TaxID=1813871 RepID=A0A5B8V5F6_9BACT|nr:hemerythrin domain-containing protein [Panacibacter ginsenosidivorans]QEC65826.1 hemerythrin domain-containing protein [Panacibacter ginsenosidivorans]